MKWILPLLALTVALTGCVRLKTEPIRVEPIEITMNVNLRVVQEVTRFLRGTGCAFDGHDPPAPEDPQPNEK